jgi:hypothetical protein
MDPGYAEEPPKGPIKKLVCTLLFPAIKPWGQYTPLLWENFDVALATPKFLMATDRVLFHTKRLAA